ncbi:TPA: ClpX C4-type zinc finger protein [Providencia alcalifaciens]
MSILCDFCEKNGRDVMQMMGCSENKSHICDECITYAAKTIGIAKDSEAPTARTDEASDLSGTKE